MTGITTRDVEYTLGGTRMLGLLVAPADATALPGIVLLHDAFGIGEDLITTARRYAELGYPVFAADLWGDRTTPRGGDEIGPLIGALASDRAEWTGRVEAAHATALAQPEFAGPVVTIGYCFGGASALEHLRVGGRTDGVVAIHAGLDLLGEEWSAEAARVPVAVLTGSADPMATPAQWQKLKAALDAASIPWELDLYSGARHAFTSPRAGLGGMSEVAAYDPRAASRSWARTVGFLGEVLQTSTSEGTE